MAKTWMRLPAKSRLRRVDEQAISTTRNSSLKIGSTYISNYYLNYHLNKSNPFIEPNCRKCHQGPETPAHLIVSCEAYANHRRDAFDGQDVLATPGFGWNIVQIRRFLMDSDLWTVMDYLE
jgi:hypothetical protein